MNKQKRALIIYNSKNTLMGSLRGFKPDGNEFKNRAMDAADYYRSKGYDVETYDLNTKHNSTKDAIDRRLYLFHILKVENINIKIHGAQEFDRILFFFHGGKYNLDRNMISMDNIGRLAKYIRSVASPNCKIVLFSCWTGCEPDGFSAELSSATILDVIAHTTRGHTTRNPHTVKVSPTNLALGGSVITELWHQYGGIRALKKRLAFDKKDPSSNYRPFEFVEEVFSGE